MISGSPPRAKWVRAPGAKGFMNRKSYLGISRALVFLASSALVGTVMAAPTKIVTGPDTGLPPQINLYSPSGANTGSFFAENASFVGGVRVAMGDIVTTNDVITGLGPGAASIVKVFRGTTGNVVYSLLPFGADYTLGVFVAAGDVNGDGRADIIVGSGEGPGEARVKVYSGADGATILHDFLVFGPGFQGGVRVAAGDVNGAGFADIMCGTGNGATEVVVFSGKDRSLLNAFTAYPGNTGGVYVAAGDINGDGLDDVITGAGTGSSNVKVFNATNGLVLQDFVAFGSTGGVRVASSDLNGDGHADIIAGTGPGVATQVRAFDGVNLSVLADIIPYGTATAGVFPAAMPHFPAQSLNISTRAKVLTGDNVVIGGFIIKGTDAKDVLIRGIGRSSGVPGALDDPTLQLYSGNTLVASNDNWKDTQRAQIEATGIPPGDDFESAIFQSLPPGSYTAILRGNNNSTGIGLIEIYDLNAATTDSQLANISTRAFVQTGDSVMIAGAILGGGSGANSLLIRALGPSLAQFGVTNTLSNPTLGLYNPQGTLLRGNDDWQESQESEIRGTGLAPANDSESAILALLPPGNYTAIVGGTNGASGVALVEIYNLQ
jgi:hypothetical protein